MTTVSLNHLVRESHYSGDPNVRVVEFTREILRSLHSGLFRALTCDIAEFYFNPGVALDLSNPVNRAKFHNGSLKPIALGPDGSVPTGTPPLLYLRVANTVLASDPYDFPVNASGNGSMDLVTVDDNGRGYGIAPTPRPID